MISLREFQAGPLESCRHVLLLAKTNKRVEKWDSAEWGEKKKQFLLLPKAKRLVRYPGVTGESRLLLL